MLDGANLLDQVIALFRPRWALRRLAARRALAQGIEPEPEPETWLERRARARGEIWRLRWKRPAQPCYRHNGRGGPSGPLTKSRATADEPAPGFP
jgi:hypothetical protein